MCPRESVWQCVDSMSGNSSFAKSLTVETNRSSMASDLISRSFRISLYAGPPPATTCRRRYKWCPLRTPLESRLLSGSNGWLVSLFTIVHVTGLFSASIDATLHQLRVYPMLVVVYQGTV